MGTAERQGELWGAAAEVWAELQEPTTIPLYGATFDAIGLRDGTRLLDASCGAGLALQLAQKRGATVTGFDASAGMLAVARSRLPGVVLRQGDLEELPFDDDSFDAVTSFNGVQYAADPVRALGEITRVCAAGAPVAVASWGDPERCDARAIIEAVGSLLPPPPPGAAGPFALAAPGALEALVERAQLSAEDAIEVDVPFEYADVATALRANRSAGPNRAAIEHAGIEKVETTFRSALEPFVRDDGSVRLDNVFRVVIARA